MDTGIIITLIIAAAGIISSTILGYAGIRKTKVEALKKKITTLAQDVDYFYEIESVLVERLSRETSQNANTLKKEIRKIVQEKKQRPLSYFAKPSEISKLIR